MIPISARRVVTFRPSKKLKAVLQRQPHDSQHKTQVAHSTVAGKKRYCIIGKWNKRSSAGCGFVTKSLRIYMVQITDQASGDYCCRRSAAKQKNARPKQQGKRTTARSPLLPFFMVNFSVACSAIEKQFCKTG